MSKPKILIVWSNYHKELAKLQVDGCLELLNQSDYEYKVETVEAGCYEIPAVIRYYQEKNPFDGYIVLGLLLKGATDHYEFIWEHIKECFIKFTMDGLVIGNGIISAPTMDLLVSRLVSNERSKEAFAAVDYLIKLKMKAAHHAAELL